MEWLTALKCIVRSSLDQYSLIEQSLCSKIPNKALKCSKITVRNIANLNESIMGTLKSIIGEKFRKFLKAFWTKL